jgi:hypothetical protein
LTSAEWKFLLISGEKFLQTIWNEIPSKIEGLQYSNLTQDAIWNTARTHEIDRPLAQPEARRVQEGQSKEVVSKEIFCRLRPDGISVLPPVGIKDDVFCIQTYV